MVDGTDLKVMLSYPPSVDVRGLLGSRTSDGRRVCIGSSLCCGSAITRFMMNSECLAEQIEKNKYFLGQKTRIDYLDWFSESRRARVDCAC